MLLDLLYNIYSSMHKQLNISTDSIFIQLHIKWIGKYISINQIRYYISDNLCLHIYEPMKLSPQSSISR